MIDINKVTVAGTVDSTPITVPTKYGPIWKFQVAVQRLSGAVDKIQIVTPSNNPVSCDLQPGDLVSIAGSFRSYNNKSGVGPRLVLNVYTKDIQHISEPKNENEIILSGSLCKPPVLRRTPLNRDITDLILAVRRIRNKADYIPVITWGTIAKEIAEMKTGDRVSLIGRIQSRDYVKVIDGVEETRTAYEVSMMKYYG